MPTYSYIPRARNSNLLVLVEAETSNRAAKLLQRSTEHTTMVFLIDTSRVKLAPLTRTSILSLLSSYERYPDVLVITATSNELFNAGYLHTMLEYLPSN